MFVLKAARQPEEVQGKGKREVSVKLAFWEGF